MPNLRFLATPGQAPGLVDGAVDNLRVTVYTQDRASVLGTFDEDVTEEAKGSYVVDVGNLTGVWFVTVELIDTEELAASGFASADQPELDDPRASLILAVLPGRDRAIDRPDGGRIVVYLNEELTIARAVEDANGNPINLAGQDLQFVIEDARGNDIAVIGSGGSGSITIGGTGSSTYSLACPAIASAKLGAYKYSLNNLTSKSLVTSGDWIVRRRAVKNS